MKLTIAFLVVLVAYTCADSGAEWKELKDKFKAAHKKCKDVSKTDKDASKKEKGTPGPPRKIKCRWACILEEFEVLNEDGTIKEDKVSEILAGKDELIEIVKQCSANATAGQDKCDAAYALQKCVKKSKGKGKKDDSEKGGEDSEKGDEDSEKGDEDSEKGDKDSEKGDKDSEKGDKDSEKGDKDSEKGDEEEKKQE